MEHFVFGNRIGDGEVAGDTGLGQFAAEALQFSGGAPELTIGKDFLQALGAERGEDGGGV